MANKAVNSEIIKDFKHLVYSLISLFIHGLKEKTLS